GALAGTDDESPNGGRSDDASSDDGAPDGSSDQVAHVSNEGAAAGDDGDLGQSGQDDSEAYRVLDGSPNKIDLLIVADNSRAMAYKQELFAKVVPDLIEGVTNPACVDEENNEVPRPGSASDACPRGSRRAFNPVKDVHVAVITTSLGGYGAALDCVQSEYSSKSEQTVDMAHLLGGLPRGAAAAASASASGFLTWTATSQRDSFVGE